MLRSFMGNLVRNADTGGAPAAAPPAAPALAGAAALAQPPAAPAAPAASAGEGAPPPAEKAWWESLPDPLKGTAAAKQWKDPAAAVESYVNLEKLMGADKAERTVLRPKDDATPDEVAQFYKALGVPETADKYEIKVPEGLQADVVDQAKAWLHNAAVPANLAQRLVDAVGAAEMAKAQEWAKQSKAEMNDLAVEWGTKFEDNAEIARRAYRAGGLSADQVEKIEMAIGTKTMLNMFHKFGMNLTEATAPAPGQGGGQFVVNKAEAAQKIAQLQASPDFQARYLSPNNLVRQAAIAEMENLQKLASG